MIALFAALQLVAAPFMSGEVGATALTDVETMSERVFHTVVNTFTQASGGIAE